MGTRKRSFGTLKTAREGFPRAPHNRATNVSGLTSGGRGAIDHRGHARYSPVSSILNRLAFVATRVAQLRGPGYFAKKSWEVVLVLPYIKLMFSMPTEADKSIKFRLFLGQRRLRLGAAPLAIPDATWMVIFTSHSHAARVHFTKSSLGWAVARLWCAKGPDVGERQD